MKKAKEVNLRNGRMVNHSGIHDVFVDNKMVLEGKDYFECRKWILDNCADNDFYVEHPKHTGEFVKYMRTPIKYKIKGTLEIPRKAGDKFTCNRFNKEKSWNEEYTAAGFCDRDESTQYSKLSRLLKTGKVSLITNMELDLNKANYSYNEILVKIVETGGYIPIRDCVLIKE